MVSEELSIQVKVGGDYACFTRPEFKVERVSYLIMTPSAARGILEAIFWKPEFRYQIREIQVLKMGSQINILRNELSSSQSTRPVTIENDRQQRSSLILKEVAYLIDAGIILRPHSKHREKAYYEQFKRRVERGQCHHTPYLGTREFAAYFEPPQGDKYDEALSLDLGTMLFDIAFVEDARRPEMEFLRSGIDGKQHKVKGCTKALFFQAKIRGGKLKVPPEKYRELYSLEARDV